MDLLKVSPTLCILFNKWYTSHVTPTEENMDEYCYHSDFLCNNTTALL